MSSALFLVVCKGQRVAKATESEERSGRGLEWLNPLTWFRKNDQSLPNDDVISRSQLLGLGKRRLHLPSVEEPNFLMFNRRQNDKVAYFDMASDLDFSVKPENCDQIFTKKSFFVKKLP